MPAQSKVSKTLLPHHSAPRLGLSVEEQNQKLKRAQFKCGSWLAGDGINWVYLMHRGVCIAGKPAPTEKRLVFNTQVGFQAAVLLLLILI
ncbi:MAG: hypothetical protein ACLGJE_07335 [Gammaproteobacteria bacterium]